MPYTRCMDPYHRTELFDVDIRGKLLKFSGLISVPNFVTMSLALGLNNSFCNFAIFPILRTLLRRAHTLGRGGGDKDTTFGLKRNLDSMGNHRLMKDLRFC